MRSRGLLSGLALAVLLPAAAVAGQAGPPAADTYDSTLAEARELAAAGRYAAAAYALQSAAETWPQDFPLQLARAYYLLRAGRYQAAADGYRTALALEPESKDARLGLDDALAERGAPSRGWLGFYGGGTGWSGHPSRTSLASGALTLDAVLDDRWSLGLLYRGLLTPAAGSSGPGRASASAPELSHEGQLALGLAASRWSLTLHGAAVSGSTLTAGRVTETSGYGGAAVGLAGSLHLGLDWRASAAFISWEDQSSAQVEASATLPIGRRLSIQAGWRGQRLDGSVSGAALLGVAWAGPWTLSLRGEYGHQRRPWDLEARTLYGLPEELRAAVRFQTSVPLGGTVRGWLGADWEAWRTPAAGATPTDSSSTRLSAGLIFSL
jgi:hypothetical protein